MAGWVMNKQSQKPSMPSTLGNGVPNYLAPIAGLGDWNTGLTGQMADAYGTIGAAAEQAKGAIGAAKENAAGAKGAAMYQGMGAAEASRFNALSGLANAYATDSTGRYNAVSNDNQGRFAAYAGAEAARQNAMANEAGARFGAYAGAEAARQNAMANEAGALYSGLSAAESGRYGALSGLAGAMSGDASAFYGSNAAAEAARMNAQAAEAGALYGSYGMAEAARQTSLGNLGSAALGAYGNTSNQALQAWAFQQKAYNDALAAMQASSQGAMSGLGQSRNAALGQLGNAYSSAGSSLGAASSIGDIGMGGGSSFTASDPSGVVGAGSYSTPSTPQRTSQIPGIASQTFGGLGAVGSQLMSPDIANNLNANANMGLESLNSQMASSRGMPSQMQSQAYGDLMGLSRQFIAPTMAGMNQFYDAARNSRQGVGGLSQFYQANAAGRPNFSPIGEALTRPTEFTQAGADGRTAPLQRPDFSLDQFYNNAANYVPDFAGGMTQFYGAAPGIAASYGDAPDFSGVEDALSKKTSFTTNPAPQSTASTGAGSSTASYSAGTPVAPAAAPASRMPAIEDLHASRKMMTGSRPYTPQQAKTAALDYGRGYADKQALMGFYPAGSAKYWKDVELMAQQAMAGSAAGNRVLAMYQ